MFICCVRGVVHLILEGEQPILKKVEKLCYSYKTCFFLLLNIVLGWTGRNSSQVSSKGGGGDVPDFTDLVVERCPFL